jgi:hypothetical protein
MLAACLSKNSCVMRLSLRAMKRSVGTFSGVRKTRVGEIGLNRPPELDSTALGRSLKSSRQAASVPSFGAFAAQLSKSKPAVSRRLLSSTNESISLRPSSARIRVRPWLWLLSLFLLALHVSQEGWGRAVFRSEPGVPNREEWSDSAMLGAPPQSLRST